MILKQEGFISSSKVLVGALKDEFTQTHLPSGAVHRLGGVDAERDSLSAAGHSSSDSSTRTRDRLETETQQEQMEEELRPVSLLQSRAPSQVKNKIQIIDL